MKVVLGICVVLAACFFLSSEAFARGKDSYSSGYSPGGSHGVGGYTRKDGTYVAPHRQTNPDSSKMNNWSTKGNVNPYTGKEGTKPPYK